MQCHGDLERDEWARRRRGERKGEERRAGEGGFLINFMDGCTHIGLLPSDDKYDILIQSGGQCVPI